MFKVTGGRGRVVWGECILWNSRIVQIALHTYPARALKDHNLEKSGNGERIQVNVEEKCMPPLHLEREVFFSISTCLRRHSLYGSAGKESVCNPGDSDLIPMLGRFPGEGNGNLSDAFAWESPWTEEPTVHRGESVRHDLATKLPQPVYVMRVLLSCHHLNWVPCGIRKYCFLLFLRFLEA